MRKYYYSLTQPPKWILENERMTHKDTDFIFSFMKMTMFLSVKRDIVLWPNFRISQQIDKVSEENVLSSFIILTRCRVLWFMDGVVLSELPNCPSKSSISASVSDDLCHVDPRDGVQWRDDHHYHIISITADLLLSTSPQLSSLHVSDPSKLVLESVNRVFSGSFSCIGVNPAGRSSMSNSIKLKVGLLRIAATKKPYRLLLCSQYYRFGIHLVQPN